MSNIEAKSEISGRVIDIVATTGQTLSKDDPILIVEAMKMEIPVCAPRSGVLREIRVVQDENVKEGQVLAVLSPD
jgi:acetyl-CoA carboxylase biotin carboxyl carrier protein